jgi:hypothetical protein
MSLPLLLSSVSSWFWVWSVFLVTTIPTTIVLVTGLPADVRISIPLNVDIWLIGDFTPMQSSQDSTSDVLSRALQDILPIFSPNQYYNSNNNNVDYVQYELVYKVKQFASNDELLSKKFWNEYEELILSSRLEESSDVSKVYQVAVSEINNLLNKYENHMAGGTLSTLPIVLFADRAQSGTLPAHTIVSTSLTTSSSCTQSMIGTQFAFYDLTAKPCDLSSDHNNNALMQRWSAFVDSTPYPFVFPSDTKQSNPWTIFTRRNTNTLVASKQEAVRKTMNTYTTGQFVARVCGLVTSAVQALAVVSGEDMRMHHVGFSADTIFVPIVIILNHQQHQLVEDRKQQTHLLSSAELKSANPQANTDPKKDSSKQSKSSLVDLNITLIEQWIRPLLLRSSANEMNNNKEIVLVPSIQFTDEHPSVSIALAAATKFFHITNTDATASTTINKQTEGKDKIIKPTRKVPYISATQFLQELRQATAHTNTRGNNNNDLFTQLLSSAGHGEAISSMAALSAAEFSLFERANNNNKRSKRQRKLEEVNSKDKSSWFANGKSGRANKNKVAVVPVIVLGGMHMYANINDTSYTSSSKQKQKSSNQYVQPLFDGVDQVTVVDNTVLAMYSHNNHNGNEQENGNQNDSRGGGVIVYSPTSGQGREVDLSDINAVIAAGLSTALTGLRAPHIRTSTSQSRVDATWTHGVHPFAPFGTFARSSRQSSSGQSSPSLLAFKSQRSALFFTLQQLVTNIVHIDSRVSTLIHEIVESIVLLDGLAGSSSVISSSAFVDQEAERNGKDLANATIEELIHPLGLFKAAPKNSKYASMISDSLLQTLIAAVDMNTELSLQLTEIQAAVSTLTQPTLLAEWLEHVHEVNDHVELVMTQLDDWEQSVLTHLSACTVTFDEDVKLSQRRAQEDFAASGGSMNTHVKRVLLRWMRTNVLLVGAGALVCVAAVFVGIRFIMQYLESKAKKLK